ncbi:DUF3187 family protein [Nevskia sp.]|uniref:DUF3187 family protein n=1 Tax=Nevskia sp. TaxID=1929292 RepID=UPI0025CDD8AD|nr:DUF3187 family protein [Nevskia sp.]
MTAPRPLIAACLVAATALAAPIAHAEPLLPVRNEAAFSRSTALPTLGEARVLDGGERAYSARLDWSNEFVNAQALDEALLIDGETQRVTFGLRQGVAPGVELGIDVPLLFTNGGVLDGVIEGWHDLFNLPNGGRETRPRRQTNYRYTRNGQTLVDVTDSTNGIGDVELSAGFAIRDDFAFRALAKVPTGRGNRLQGGNLGGAVWFDFDPFSDSARWFGYVSGGVSYNGDADLLAGQQKKLVGLGGAGAGYRVLRRLSLVAQFNAHTPLYKGSSIDALSRAGGQLAFGGRIALGPHTVLDLGVQEDVLLSSSPDFSIHIGLGFR